MKPILTVVGPTAVGKTDISLKLAKELNGEIVSCDSMQIYKYMDIGTAKPSLEERMGIPHHMIDIITPDINYSVAEFVKTARACIDDIHKRGKLPVLVGGTGLYADSIIKNTEFSKAAADESERQRLNDIYEQYGAEYLHKMLKEIDPQSYDKLHPNDVRRVIRALEVYHTTGICISEHNAVSRKGSLLYNTLMIGLNMDRSKLYERINMRVDIMLEKGLLKEVEYLLRKNPSKTAMQAIGYKELFNYLENRCTFCEAVESIKQESRRYAKRQLCWFKRNDAINWYESSECYDNITKLIEFAKNNLHYE